VEIILYDAATRLHACAAVTAELDAAIRKEHLADFGSGFTRRFERSSDQRSSVSTGMRACDDSNNLHLNFLRAHDDDVPSVFIAQAAA
jgi:hypothetical protein